jgi:hypothetical protein
MRRTSGALLAGLHLQTLRIYGREGLAGIRRVLQLPEETRQLQAKVARLGKLTEPLCAPRGGAFPRKRPATISAG